MLLRELRSYYGLRQAEFAQRIGVEQSYVSAIEVGAKGPPNDEFVSRLVFAFDLDLEWRDRLVEALDHSQRKLELSREASVESYRILNKLRKQMDDLHPAQIELIEYALKLPAVIRLHESTPRSTRFAQPKKIGPDEESQ